MGMPTEVLRNAVLSFASSLKSTDAVTRFFEARRKLETDAELSRSREAFNQAARSFREKQAAGTLTEQEISRVRTLQANLNLHPRTVELLHAQQEMAELLQECNQQIFEVLGLDFSAIAAPSGCC
jgi:cell fate (sporulation/competence/biofilm development) regulator YlbF (YheA/YmcA/DUF963 family)